MIRIAELREMLRPRPEDDHLLPMLEAQVAALWERETALAWEERDDAEFVLDVDPPQPTILIPTVRVASVDSVEVRSATEDDEYEELDPTEYLLVGPRALRRLGSAVGWSGLVKVTAAVGVAPDALAADVRHALVTQVRFMLERMQPGNVAVASKGSPELGTTSYLAADLHPLFARAAAAHCARA